MSPIVIFPVWLINNKIVLKLIAKFYLTQRSTCISIFIEVLTILY